MSVFQERMKREQQRREEEKNGRSGGNFVKTDNFFKWQKQEHTIRLVGDFLITHNHWIGPSAFNSVSLFDEKNFVGEEKLPHQMNCANWDIETEVENKKGECVICKLRKIAGDILYSEEGKSLDEKNKKFFKDLKYKCDVKTRYYFNCIDRDNPYVNVEEKLKGYKIIEIPYDLMEGIISLTEKLSGVDITSVEDGIDLVISKKGGDGSKVKYSVQPKINGMNIEKTPLTEMEKEMKLIDLKTVMGKQIDQKMLEEKLSDDIKILLEDTEDSPF